VNGAARQPAIAGQAVHSVCSALRTRASVLVQRKFQRKCGPN